MARPPGRGLPALLALLVVASLLAPIVVGAVATPTDADGDVAVTAIATDAAPGGSGRLVLGLDNERGDLEDVTVTVTSGTAGLAVGAGGTSAATYLGEWDNDTSRRVTVPASIGAGTNNRSLPVTVVVEYEVNETGRADRTTIATGVRPADASQFVAVEATTTAAVGTSGDLRLTLRNRGERTLRDARVQLSTGSGALTFGGAPTTTAHVGRWPANGTATVTVEAAVAPGTERRALPVDAVVTGTVDGATTSAAPVRLGVTPAAEQSIAVRNLTTSLRVGEDGQLAARVVNEGPATVEDAVVVLAPPSGSLQVAETEFAIGTLAPGEGANVSYDVAVSGEASPGERQFALRLRYEDANGSTTATDPAFVRAPVEPERTAFDVDAVNATVPAGSTDDLLVEITNRREGRVTDLSAKLFADAPVSVADDESFVDELAPGESVRVPFRITVAGSAMTKSYPVAMDVQYTAPDGDTELTDTVRLPVRVTESDGGGIPFLSTGGAVVGLAVVAVGGAGLVARR